MAAVIGALRVTLGADTGSFEDGLKKASDGLGKFAADITKIAGGIQLSKVFDAVIDGLKSFATAIPHAIENMDKLGKMSQKIGIPVEELSKLKVAAGLADVSLEEFGNAIVKLSKSMEAARDPFSQASAAFKALGINVKDSTGQLRPTEDVISDIAEKFSGFSDGATKTAISLALIPKSGAGLIPFFNQGAKGIKDAKKEAEEFGLVISKVTAKQAEEFNDNLKRMNFIVEGLVQQVAAYLLPALNEFSHHLVELAKDTGFAKTAVQGTITVLHTVGSAILTVAEAVAKLGSDWKGLKALFAAETFSEIAAAWKQWGADNDKLGEKFAELRGKLDAFLNRTTASADAGAIFHRVATEMKMDAEELAASLEKYTKLPPPKLPTSEEQAQAKKLSEELKNLGLKAQALQTPFFGLAEGFVQSALGMGKMGEAAVETFLKTGMLTGEFQKLNEKLLTFKGAQIVWENRDPITQYQTAMAQLNLELSKVPATQEQIARAQDKLNEKFGQGAMAMSTSVASIMGSLSSLTATLGKENKAMMIVSKAFAIGQAIINTQIAVTKALATLGPTPAGYLAAAAAIASGAAAVATIVSQGMAKGGSFIVPGGVSGVDNVMMPLGLASGERVTVETPQQQRQTSSEVTIRGVRPRDLFTGEMVRELFEAISAGRGDGYKVRFA